MPKPQPKLHRTGWKPDLPDQRDHKFSTILPPASLPPSADLRKQFPAVFDQSTLGSCTAQAVAAVIGFSQVKQKVKEVFTPSRLFIYYNERSLEGTIPEDSGATLRSGIKSVNQWGVCPEKEWPYDIINFVTKPSDRCYTHAEKHQVLSYQRIDHDIVAMKSCLAQGFPFVFGFTVYESFESSAVAKTGVVPMPLLTEQTLGGHAVVAVGYNGSDKVVNKIPPHTFIVRNSWSSKWGAKGYCFMPFDYLTNDNLADDFWSIRQIETGNESPLSKLSGWDQRNQPDIDEIREFGLPAAVEEFICLPENWVRPPKGKY